MNEENIVSLALQFYDKQKHKHAVYYNEEHRVSFVSSTSDIQLPMFNIKRGDKTVLSGQYNIIGFYFKEERKWVWGWGVNYTKKNDTYMSRNILLYGLDMQLNFKDMDDNATYNRFVLDLMVKTDLTSKEIAIEHPAQLEQYLALGLYLTKSDMVYKEESSDKFGKNVVTYFVFKYTDL